VPGICDKCGGKLFQRDDDRPETIRKRLKIYEEQINPILDYYNGRVPIVEATCTELNTPPEMVVNKIVAGLKKIGL
jgi:adenylate kinase